MASIDKFEVLIKNRICFASRRANATEKKTTNIALCREMGRIYSRQAELDHLKMSQKEHDGDTSNVEGNLCETFLVIYLENKKSNINAKFVGMAYKLLEMIKRFSAITKAANNSI